MSNIITNEDNKIDIKNFKELAEIAMKSGNYPNMGMNTMLNIMLSARDLGIAPYKALNGGFYVVNGKISMSTALMTDRIRKAGHSVKITEWSSKKCVMIGIRKDNQDSVKIEFTMEDAQMAGLTNSAVWKKYPKVMLYNRAMAMMARVLFPDVVGNCYSEDEGEEIKRNDWGSKKPIEVEENHPEMEQIEVEVEDISLELMQETIENNISLAHTEFLGEYLAMVKAKVNKPLRDVLNSWLDKPEPFVEHFTKWADKKLFEKNNEMFDKEDMQVS